MVKGNIIKINHVGTQMKQAWDFVFAHSLLDAIEKVG